MKFFILLLSLLLSGQVFGQILPHHLSDDERGLPFGIYSSNRNLSVTPPSFSTRTMAEWEEIQSIVITWNSFFEDIYLEIIEHAQQECEVIVLTKNIALTSNALTSEGISLNNVRLVYFDYNSIWTRDYSPTTIYSNSVDSIYLVDWIYDRPRPTDDTLAYLLGDIKGINVFATNTSPYDLVHVGGNFLTDGMGMAMSSSLVINENSAHSIQMIDDILEEFMGINQFITLNELPFDRIHHLDMHMKFLDEETILVGEYPSGVADGPQIESNIQYLTNNFSSSFGSPFKIERIVMPPDLYGKYPNEASSCSFDGYGCYHTYTNAMFINNTILVPTYNDPQHDTIALQQWESLKPGYKVVGINCSSLIPLTGALHCIIKAIGTNDPLRIVHQKIDGQKQSIDTDKVFATIEHRSGIQSADVYYTIDHSAGFTQVPMTLIDATLNFWLAEIPSFPGGTTVSYYIKAHANNGKSIARPMPAPNAYWEYYIDFPDGTLPVPNPATAFTIYPNPTNGDFTVDLNLVKGQVVNLQLYDLTGKLSHSLQFNGESGNHQYQFTLPELPRSTYFITLTSDELFLKQSLIVN